MHCCCCCWILVQLKVYQPQWQWQMYRNHGNSFIEFISLYAAAMAYSKKCIRIFAYRPTHTHTQRPHQTISLRILCWPLESGFAVLSIQIPHHFHSNSNCFFFTIHAQRLIVSNLTWICVLLHYNGSSDGLSRFLWLQYIFCEHFELHAFLLCFIFRLARRLYVFSVHFISRNEGLPNTILHRWKIFE